MSVERRGPVVCSSLRPRKARVNDKSTHSFARPAKENIHQGEGRHTLRFRPGNFRVSAGSGGVGKGCRAPCGCSAAVGISIFFRKLLRQDRSHKPWGEANKKAQCGKSA